MRVVRRWNRLPKEAMDAPSFLSAQSQVGLGFGQPGLVKDVSAMAEGLNLMIFRGPIQPQPFHNCLIKLGFPPKVRKKMVNEG